MRKKIFIIHGKGISRGIGREGGGDLDTVSSNAFYRVWAENALREESGGEAVYGRDFEFDFLNYSEGFGRLLAHPGCDVYLPDFPIDALATRLKLIVIEEPDSVELINRYTARADELLRWMIQHADRVGPELKEIFNATYKQVPKVLEHQEKAALLAALDLLEIIRLTAELEAGVSASGDPPSPALAGYLKGMVSHLTAGKLQALKRALLNHLDDDSKEKMIDLLDSRDDILAFDRAIREDMSTRGRVNYTDELLILTVETAAYAVRGLKQLRDLPWEKRHKRVYSLALRAVLDELRRYFRVIKALAEPVSGSLDESMGESVKGVIAACDRLLGLFDNIEEYLPAARESGGDYDLRLLLVEDATGKAVSGIEVVIGRVQGEGKMTPPGGEPTSDKTIEVETDRSGVAAVRYSPASPDEKFQFSATYDDLQVMLIPSEMSSPDEVFEALYDEVGEELVEESFEEKEDGPTAGPGRGMRVTLELMERQLRQLKENDIRIESVDDHHPYTPEVLDLLNRLKDEGLIGRVHIVALPRGKELPLEKQKCGSQIIYEERVQGKPWDNPGLAELARIARHQDLHFDMDPLGIEISKLIGSKHPKIEIADGLAAVKDFDGMREIMRRNGWDEVVRKYEEGLEKVYPRTEQALGRMVFKKPGGELTIMAAMSPFCDAKKGEVQINVASALHYLLGRRKYRTDYFFYIYGSQLMTTRKPNEKEETLNLSTLCQFIGTPADGGHSGAATCKPISNPAFPVRRLEKVRDTNFLQFLNYLAGKVAGYADIEIGRVSEVKVESFTEPEEKALKHLRETTFEIELEKEGDASDRVRVLFTRAPQVNRRAGEAKPSFLQVVNYLKRHHEFDYLVFAQGMLYRVVILNAGDDKKRIDPVSLARTMGWPEDDGDDLLALADIKKNKKVKKRLRRMLNPHLVQLANMTGAFVEAPGDYRVKKVRPLLFDGVEGDFAPVFKRMRKNSFLIELKPSGSGTPLRVVATMSPSIDRRAGETEPTIPLAAAAFKDLKPNYLIYSEHELRFPRERQISVLARVDDPARVIDCSRAVFSLVGPRHCGDETVAEFMPATLKESPLAGLSLHPTNYPDFINYIVPRLAKAADCEVASIKPL